MNLFKHLLIAICVPLAVTGLLMLAGPTATVLQEEMRRFSVVTGFDSAEEGVGGIALAAAESKKPATRCSPIDDIIGAFKVENPALTVSRPDAERYVAAFNAEPPTSAMTVPETLVILQSPRKPSVVVIAYGKGCVLWHGFLPVPSHEAIMRKIDANLDDSI